MYRWLLWLKDPENRLWVKPAVGSLAAVLFALLAVLANRFIPADVLPDIERETLDGLLRIIASSMLAVTTFSLSIMVAAFATAAGNASPRATELVAGDEDTHTAITAFISAFIYSVVALTALGTGLYGRSGRFVLFLSTLLVLAYLIVTLIRWVKTLSKLGRMSTILTKIEGAAAQAMRDHRRSPRMGALPPPPRFDGMAAVRAPRVGYVRQIDMAALQKLAEPAGLRLHIRVRPGTLVHPGTALLLVEGAEDADADALSKAFVLGDLRSYDQDPRFGLIVLSEVAQRALSPAVNDPGTAIAVMNAMTRVLIDSRIDGESVEGTRHAALTMVEIDPDDFIHQGFDPIARDGAACMEVQVRMQKLLAALADNRMLAHAARRQAALSLRRAEGGLAMAQDRQSLRRLYQSLHEPADA